MFTGLVDDIGTIEQVETQRAGLQLRVCCRHTDLAEGESIAVNGVCLTVREAGGESPSGWFTCAAVTTTRDVTTVAQWKAGDRVNIERAMRPIDRFGGHIVQGHVDGIARVTGRVEQADALLIDLALPSGLSDLMVERGSVAVDGVSLTVASLPAPDSIQLSIIEYTRRHTTLGALKVGDSVHVEADIIAKHVKKLLNATR